MTDTANASDLIMKGLSNETEGLGRFGHHPNPAIDFCIEVETLESRLHQAEHGLSKPGSVPETIAAVLHDIQKALDFRVGGDEGAVSAKHSLRSLEDKAKSLTPTDTANAPERIWAFHAGPMVGLFIGKKEVGTNVAEYVLATHCDELVAAAYLDARDSINEYPRVAPEADEANAYDEQIEHCQGIIDARTPANASAALTARDERMKAGGARDALIKELVAALQGVWDACGRARMTIRPGCGVGGMTMEANIRGSVYNGVDAWPVEVAFEALARAKEAGYGAE